MPRWSYYKAEKVKILALRVSSWENERHTIASAVYRRIRNARQGQSKKFTVKPADFEKAALEWEKLEEGERMLEDSKVFHAAGIVVEFSGQLWTRIH